jgi:hypothetical protein
MKKIKTVLSKLALLGVVLTPVLLLYWFFTNPVSLMTGLLWFGLAIVFVIVPLVLIFGFLYTVFGLLWSIIKTVFS